jgi:hypothetical protein
MAKSEHIRVEHLNYKVRAHHNHSSEGLALNGCDSASSPE